VYDDEGLCSDNDLLWPDDAVDHADDGAEHLTPLNVDNSID